MTPDAAPPPGDQASVAVGLAVPPERAFQLFTAEIDQWWRRGRRFRNAPGSEAGIVCIEPRVGGRLFESYGSGAGETVVEMGRVLAWEPPQRFVFEWRAINFAPHERTEVEVRFDATSRGTRVTVVHRGWSALRADHPVRHGLDAAAFVRMMGLWWGDLMTALRLLSEGRGPRPPS